ncbi:4-hydroxy-tetrahydrodipicolinate reductase [Candidatus Contubernalis alkalaceticus]|nr:4-hydroxy-tetrahydrodipicolinate reductase [Candidatus Contubernalis alkalaceticus]
MGKEVVRAVYAQDDLELCGAVDMGEVGKDVGELCGLGCIGVQITDDLDYTIKRLQPQVVVDFTTPFVVMKNIEITMSSGVNMVVGTTGITGVDLEKIRLKAAQNNVKAVIAPNFALGAVMMMNFARQAVRYFDSVEIIEMHHDQKVDAPSGTALKTVEMILEQKDSPAAALVQELEKIPGVRGGEMGGIKIHSIRLPGLVAHQEVIFGGLGQTLIIRHDSLNRTSFMPGVIMAIRKLSQIEGVVYGLENLL